MVTMQVDEAMIVGWEGVIARTEWTFYAFDAAMVTIAVYIFNFYNPAAYLPSDFSWSRRDSHDQSFNRHLTEKPESPSVNSTASSKSLDAGKAKILTTLLKQQVFGTEAYLLATHLNNLVTQYTISYVSGPVRLLLRHPLVHHPCRS